MKLFNALRRSASDDKYKMASDRVESCKRSYSADASFDAVLMELLLNSLNVDVRAICLVEATENCS